MKAKKKISWLLVFLLLISTFAGVTPFGTQKVQAAAGAMVFSDDFQGSGSGGLKPDWYTGYTPSAGTASYDCTADSADSTNYIFTPTVKGASGKDARAFVPGYSLTDYSVEAKVKIPELNIKTQLVGRCSDDGAATAYGNNYYAAQLLNSNGTIYIEIRRKGPTSADLGKTTLTGYTAGTWVSLKLEMIGSNLKVYVNGTEVVSQTDATISKGIAGVINSSGSIDPCSSYIDNFVITDLTKSVSTPSVPLMNAPVAGTKKADLSWTTVTDATYYTVKGGTTSGNYTMIYQTPNKDVTSYTYSGLTAGTDYYFVVSATNSAGQSLNSNEVKVTPTSVPAFPGAEGGGMYTSGGRGGDVYEVTTLADSGAGSLRDAVSQGNRTIVFRVSGNIELKSRLDIAVSNLTIAGQTAPGDGICISGYDTRIDDGCKNIIIRYVRFRPGDANIDAEPDGIWGRKLTDVILDHISSGWSTDESLSFYENTNFTLQWSLVSESLTMSGHFKGKHGYGGIWGGSNATFHHNILAHHTSRNSRIEVGGNKIPATVDLRNNIIYDWEFNSTYGGDTSSVNLINNYYKPGPMTLDTVKNRIANPSYPSNWYLFGNYMYGDAATTADNSYGYQPDPGAGATKETSPIAIEGANNIATQTAEAAYTSVLAKAGAVLPKRDAIDSRVTGDIKNGTGRAINRPYEVGGYPEYQSNTAPVDTDHDGMPDSWEEEHNLKKADSSDGKDDSGDGYTNLEKYLNSLANMSYEAANPTVTLTAPKINSLYSTGDSVEITADAAANTGSSIAKVEFYRNGIVNGVNSVIKIGESTAAPYSCTWTDLPEGTYFISARATDSNGLSTQSDSVPIYVNGPTVGAPWTSQDVGSVGISGRASLDESNVMTVKGAGTLLGSQDSFQYTYQTLDGDGELSARIDSIANIEQDAGISGIMIRQELTPDSPYALIGALHVKATDLKTPTAIEFLQRGSKGESVSVLGTPKNDSVTAYTYENGVYNINAPYWIKLSRLGNDISAFVSADGTAWTFVGTRTFANLPASVYIGFAVDAGKVNNSIENYNFAKFSGISLKNSASPVPNIVLNTAIPENTDTASFTVSAYSTVAANVAIKLNGVLLLSSTNKAANEEFTQALSFIEGANLLEISLTDAGNNTRTFTYNTVYTPKSNGGTVINNRKIDVWDFGGVQTSGELYNNIISASLYGNSSILDSLSTVGPNELTKTAGYFTGSTAFGDLSIITVNGKNDRLYYYTTNQNGDAVLGPKSYASSWNSMKNAYSDGYTSNGAYYCNGSTSDTSRYLTLNNVVAGDKISVYGGISGGGNEKLHLIYTGTDGKSQDTSADFTGTVSKTDFVAQYSGSYKITVSNGNKGKPYFHRVVRTPGVIVNGKVNLNGADKTGVSLTFKNQTTGDLTDASINPDNTFSAVLAAGYNYTAALKGTISYAVSDTTKLLSTATSEIPYGKNDVNLDVVVNKIATITGKINGFDSGYDTNKLNITFTPPADSLAEPVIATVDASNMTFTAVVKAEQAYTAVISGVNDYEVVSGANVNITSDTTHDITVGKKPVYTVTGKFAGLPSTAAIQSITFKNVDDSYTYTGTVIDGGYTASLRDGAYSVSAVCTENYETKGHVVVNESNTVKDIKFSEVNGWNLVNVTSADIAAGTYKGLTLVNGTGSFGVNGNALSAKPGTSIVIPVKAGQLVTVSGWYSGEISFKEDPTNVLTIPSSSSASAPAKISYKAAATGTVTLNITGTATAYLTAIDRVQLLDWVPDLYVGDSSKENNYSTVKDALDAAAKMNPTSEEKRITIHIAPGVYRAQLKIATPYITLVNSDPNKEVKITWYYGVGYNYYSASSDGTYNEDLAFDKYAKGYPGNGKWGATVLLTSSATGFKAENIVFENSFNKYLTNEELNDGVELAHAAGSSINVERTSSLDVTSKPATERAAAMGIDADNVEFYNCSFISSQDTLYTGGGNYNQYYKNCYIEGNTDYIFGDGNVVFDDCELNFFGYSNSAVGGYITAAKQVATYGYLFRNCEVTANAYNYQTAGYFGRPWDKGAKVKFLNTKLQSDSLINPAGWTDMSGNLPENANFYEYNTTYNGIKVDTSSRKGKIMSDDDAAAINVSDYFGDWTPSYFSYELVSDTAAPAWTDGNLNASNITSTGLTLNWNLASDNVRVVGYKIYQGTTLLGTVVTAVYSVTGLTSGTQYTFTVQAVDASGNESTTGPGITVATSAEPVPEPVIDTSAPVWPETKTLTSSKITKTSVILTWSSANDNTGVTSYRVYNGSTLAATVTGSENSTEITGLDLGTYYTFTVQAGDEAGNWSSDGPSITVKTQAPGSKPTAPVTPTVPAATDTSTVNGATVSTKATLDSATGTATAEISAASIDTALDNAKADSKGVKTATITVAPVEGAKAYEQTLPACTFSESSKGTKIVIDTPIADVIVPGNALSAVVLTSESKTSFNIGSVDTSTIKDAALAGIIGTRPAVSFDVKIDGQSVTKPLEGNVKLTIPYTATGDEAEKLTVVRINTDGTVAKIGSSKYEKDSAGVTFKANEPGTYAVVYDPKTFSDLDSSSWAKNQIEVLASKGVISGTSETTFSPAENIKRADFIMMLVKTLDLKAPASNDNFADVKSSDYYYNALAVAKKLGIVKGTGDNLFNPEEQISRQDMMVICERALEQSELINSKATSKDIEKYKDNSLVSNYAVDSVAKMVNEGLITGDGTNLNPLGNASRAETAVIIYRILQRL